MTWRPRYSWRTLILFTLLVTSGVGLWYAARRPAWVKICTLKDASPYDFIPPGAKAILWRGHLLKYLAEEKGPEAEGVIVDTETGQIVGRLPGMKAVLGGKVSPGGRWATPTGFYSTEIWDIERRVKLRDQLGMPAAFQEDDSLMVLALPNAVEIRKTETNELVGSLDMPDGEGRGTVSSDGSVLLRQ